MSARPTRSRNRSHSGTRRGSNRGRFLALEPLEDRLLMSQGVIPGSDALWQIGEPLQGAAVAEVAPQTPAPSDCGEANGRAEQQINVGGPASIQDLRTSSRTGVFDVYVEPGLLRRVSRSLETYAADLEAEGYTVTVREFRGSAEQLRSHLRYRWSKGGLEGALFVGDLPHVDFTSEDNFRDVSEIATYPHDLYFMDLDGRYVFHRDGVDQHTAGRGDVGPEIYVSRITTSNLWIRGRSEAALINDYFAKVHAYRSGQLRYEDRGLVFADDDWDYWQADQMAGLYTDVTLMNDPADTTREGYLDVLNSNYESILVGIHSYPDELRIDTGAGQESFHSVEYLRANPRAGFYNMFHCSGARYTEDGFLAGMYLYGGDYGLNVVGSTKTGSMRHFEDYYTPLSQGDSVGQAFQQWFAIHAVATNDADHDTSVDWWYGMTMQGDPTLRPATMGDTPEPADHDLPDLKGRSFESQEPLVWGQKFGVDATIANQGRARAGRSVVKFYLSNDRTINRRDVYLGSTTVAALAAGDTYTIEDLALRLPHRTPRSFSHTDRVYIGMIVDANNQVSECHDLNNANLGRGMDWDAVCVTLAGKPAWRTGVSDSRVPVGWRQAFNADTTVHTRRLGFGGPVPGATGAPAGASGTANPTSPGSRLPSLPDSGIASGLTASWRHAGRTAQHVTRSDWGRAPVEVGDVDPINALGLDYSRAMDVAQSGRMDASGQARGAEAHRPTGPDSFRLAEDLTEGLAPNGGVHVLLDAGRHMHGIDAVVAHLAPLLMLA